VNWINENPGPVLTICGAIFIFLQYFWKLYIDSHERKLKDELFPRVREVEKFFEKRVYALELNHEQNDKELKQLSSDVKDIRQEIVSMGRSLEGIKERQKGMISTIDHNTAAMVELIEAIKEKI